MGWYSEIKQFLDDYQENKKKTIIIALLCILAIGLSAGYVSIITGFFKQSDEPPAKQQSAQTQQTQQALPQKRMTYREANKIYTHKSIVEDMGGTFDKRKKVYVAYGEDNRVDPTAILGNEWFTGWGFRQKSKEARGVAKYEAKLEGDYYAFEIPDIAASAQTPIFKSYQPGKVETWVKGFRFNYCQLDNDDKPIAWSQIHNHVDELGGHYILGNIDQDGANRNGIIYKDL